MTIEQVQDRVATRRWDLLDPTVRIVLVLALLASLATIVAADTDLMRYSAVALVLVVAPVIGWLRGTGGRSLS